MDDQDDDFLDWGPRAPTPPSDGDAAFPFSDTVPIPPAVEQPSPDAGVSSAPRGDRRTRDRLVRLVIAAALIVVWTMAAIAFFARDDEGPTRAVQAGPATAPSGIAVAAPAPKTVVASTPAAAASPLPPAPAPPRASVGPAPAPVTRAAEPSRPALPVVRTAPARRQVAQAERPRPARRQATRTANASAAAPARADTITCILPSGQDVAMSQAACRARSGLIYR